MSWCLVTGASSGIGRAIAVRLSSVGINVIAVARRNEGLLETKALGVSSNIHVLLGDVSTEEGRNAVVSRVSELKIENGINFVVHNAGLVGPICGTEEISYSEWKKVMELNVDAPLFLTQKLLPLMSTKYSPRILHVGSGAAHSAVDGWTSYCVSKAALLMLYKCLKHDLKKKGVLVGSMLPGIVETAMQRTIREATVNEMQDAEMFRKLKLHEFAGETSSPHVPPTDGLDNVENPAFFIEFLLTKTFDHEFSEKEWDIRDTSHHSRWII